VVDVFSEVDEQLRSDQIKNLFLKYLPGVLGGLAALLVLAFAYWGFSSYRQSTAEKASAAYAQGMDSLTKGDSAAAFAQFAVAAKSASAIYRSLALQQQGAIRLDQNKVSEAVSLFDEAAKAAPDPVVADTARLKSAYALLDTASYADLEARLKPLTDAQRPLSAMAKECLAFAELKAGKTSAARSDFVVLSLLASASDDIRQRAGAAIAMIDKGQGPQLVATVKAALTQSSNPLFPEGPPVSGPAPTANAQPEPAQ
jgi:hypothetical protein